MNLERPRTYSLLMALTMMMGCSQHADVPDDGDTASSDVEVHDIVIPEGSLWIEMGNYDDTTYTRFDAEGSELIIVNGVQGGEWIMPAVRMLGGESKAVVTCSVITEDDEVVGESFMTVKFFPSDDGWQEIKFYPVRITRDEAHASEPLAGLYGQRALLQISVVDDADRVGEARYDVILAGE